MREDDVRLEIREVRRLICKYYRELCEESQEIFDIELEKYSRESTYLLEKYLRGE